MGRVAWLAFFAATGILIPAACGLDRDGMLEQVPGSGGSAQSVGGATTSAGGVPNAGGGPVTVSSSTGVGGSGMVGDPCVENADCENDQCVDSFCCNHACRGTCESCNQPGMEGSCQPIPEGTDPDTECDTDEACDGSDECKGVQGTDCEGPADCISNQCFDLYCCDTSCGGKCRGCDVSGSEGSCTFYQPADLDPDDDCPGNQVCNGAGDCQ